MQKFYWPSSYPHSYKDDTLCRKVDGRHTSHLSTISTPQYNTSGGQSRPTPPYPPLTLPVNTTHYGVQVNITSSDNTHQHQTTGRHTVVRLGGDSSDKRCVSVRVTRGDRESRQVTEEDIYSSLAIPPVRLRQADKVGQRWNQKNKTWNQNTLSQAEYECGIVQDSRKEKRQSIHNIDFFNHNYENVYDNTNNVTDTAADFETLNITPNKNLYESETKPQASNRQTPRSRKKAKAPNTAFRSKSCDRGVVAAVLLDNLSCMSRSGRTSPADSLACQSIDQYCLKDTPRPAQSLAHRMRGRLEYVNKKMNMIRSRSAERLRGCTSAVRSEVIAVDQTRTRPVLTDTAYVYSGPFIGQARAVVDCVPSPYDRDALPFSRDDLIDIIAMNAGGLWRGRCGDRVGSFKFVNVEILPTRSRRRSRSRSLRRIKRKPATVAEVMRVLNMEEHLPVFVLNGYEDLTLFKDLDDEELNYLGISDEEQREKLIAMAELLFPDDTKDKSGDESEIDDISSESGVADINSDGSVNSYNSYQNKNTARTK